MRLTTRILPTPTVDSVYKVTMVATGQPWCQGHEGPSQSSLMNEYEQGRVVLV